LRARSTVAGIKVHGATVFAALTGSAETLETDRSARARQLVAEGRFGGPEFGKLGGRPRKLRASPELADAAYDNVDDIVTALRDGLSASQPMATRLRAVRLWLEIQQQSR